MKHRNLKPKLCKHEKAIKKAGKYRPAKTNKHNTSNRI